MTRFTGFIFMLVFCSTLTARGDSTLEQIISDIENAGSADDLYTARMNLKRLTKPESPSNEELMLWQKALKPSHG